MLIKHQKLLAIIPRTVKSAALLAVTALSLSMPAQGYELTEKKYTVKFKLSELHATNGLETVYTRLQKKAAKACRFDRGFSANGTELSSQACTADLLNQFVKTANITKLTVYHRHKLSAH